MAEVERERAREMIFSVFGGSLISFVMGNSSFLPLPSHSDQNSKRIDTNFEGGCFCLKIEIGVTADVVFWHLTEM